MPVADGEEPESGIVLDSTGERNVVELWGSADLALRDLAGPLFTELSRMERPLVIDTARVEFIDSVGLTILVTLANLAMAAEQPVTLRAPSTTVASLIAMTGLGDLLPPETAAS